MQPVMLYCARVCVMCQYNNNQYADMVRLQLQYKSVKDEMCKLQMQLASIDSQVVPGRHSNEYDRLVIHCCCCCCCCCWFWYAVVVVFIIFTACEIISVDCIKHKWVSRAPCFRWLPNLTLNFCVPRINRNNYSWLNPPLNFICRKSAEKIRIFNFFFT